MHKFRYLLIVFIVALGWFWRFQTVLGPIRALPNDKEVRVRGVISSPPYQNDSKQIMAVGAYRAAIEPFPRFEYGDRVEMVGKLDIRLTNFTKPQIWLVNPAIRLVEENGFKGQLSLGSMKKGLIGIRNKLMQLFLKILPEPQASLLSGVVLGVKRSLPHAFSEALRNTGTLHVVVASGYNVTVVAGVLAAVVVQFASRKLAVPFILVGVAGYTIMAGADPPILRAAMMGGLIFTAQFLGKQYTGLWALVIVSIIMLFAAPLLLFDIGFQLSVAATAGILLVQPILSRKAYKFERVIGKTLADNLSVTLGAQLMVLPLLLFHFRQVSWLSPLANLAVGFVVPIIMGLGGVIGLVGLLSNSLAQLLGFFAWVPLTYFVEVVNWFDRLPFGGVKVSEFGWWWVGLYYLVVVLIVLRKKDKKFKFLEVVFDEKKV